MENLGAALWKGTVIILRTNSLSNEDVVRCRRIAAASDFRIVVVADERAGAFDARGLTKINYTEQAAMSLGLYFENDTPWRCGDYVFYIARQYFPGASFFWVIEPDVHVNSESISYPFSFFSHDCNTDLIAARLDEAGQSWIWHQSMNRVHKSVHSIFFPLVRLSGRAVDYLFWRRRFLSEAYKQGASFISGMWPNDEAFVATELINGDFITRDMNSYDAELYDKTSFNALRPLLRGMIPSKYDGKVRHPVLPVLESFTKFERYIKEIGNESDEWSKEQVVYADMYFRLVIKEHPYWSEKIKQLLLENGYPKIITSID